MSLSVFEMHSVELFCQRPPGACYVICDEWHYKACLGKAADLQRARAETREFLAIAALNRRKWEEDRKLIRNLIGSHWLFFHDVRDRNPDTDGWWVIVALLEEIRRGKLLAVKGPRNGLFPSPYSSTPLMNPIARTGSHPDGEPILSVQYDPATWQTRLNAARAARAGDRGSSTLLGDAQPFEYVPDALSGDVVELAESTNNPNYAAKMLGYDRKTFGRMIHMMKEDNRMRGDDNVIWHDDGNVEFRGAIIDNMHSWAP
ncbi:hypothetical protein OKW38_004649 [Paraburkholderia sp. MM5496-R1]|uniref:Uncharacterized protein n=1 Tax=Paraburkholderia tuberum TaxID=157910 RepID=A0A1H1B3P9_9BURK|nr:hypothetical protein [Paraburkholderia tuberum]SDQ46540.1 hypothetical protein SAMN05445850_0714 [Paraburkholderia tuberum]